MGELFMLFDFVVVLISVGEMFLGVFLFGFVFVGFYMLFIFGFVFLNLKVVLVVYEEGIFMC